MTPDLTHQEQRLIRELQASGVRVSSVWDLVNCPTHIYHQAEAILIRHLAIATDEKLVEGLARTVTHKFFRNAVPSLIDQFRRVHEHSTRWAIGSAISHIGFRGFETDVLSLIAEPGFGAAREMLVCRAHRIKDPSVEPVLLALLADPVLDYFAASALSYCGSRVALDALLGLDLSTRSLRTRRGVLKDIARLSRRLSAT